MKTSKEMFEALGYKQVYNKNYMAIYWKRVEGYESEIIDEIACYSTTKTFSGITDLNDKCNIGWRERKSRFRASEMYKNPLVASRDKIAFSKEEQEAAQVAAKELESLFNKQTSCCDRECGGEHSYIKEPLYKLEDSPMYSREPMYKISEQVKENWESKGENQCEN